MTNTIDREGLRTLLQEIFTSDDVFRSQDPDSCRQEVMTDLVQLLCKHFGAECRVETSSTRQWRALVSPIQGVRFGNELWGTAPAITQANNSSVWYPVTLDESKVFTEEISLEILCSKDMTAFDQDIANYMSRISNRFLLDYEREHKVLVDMFSEAHVYQGKVSFSVLIESDDTAYVDDVFMMVSAFVQEKLVPGAHLVLRSFVAQGLPVCDLPVIKSVRLSRTQTAPG